MSRLRQAIERFDRFCVAAEPRFLRARPRLLILALHTVLADEGELQSLQLHPQQQLTLEDLRSAIRNLRSLGYTFANARSVQNGLPQGNYCLVTFDDGYANNLRAVPVLREEGVPALFFVVPENIETGRSFWWDAIYRKCSLAGLSTHESEALIAMVKKVPAAEVTNYLRGKGFGAADFMPVGDLDRPLTRPELIQLSALPGVEIGNHTWAHEILTNCAKNEARSSLRTAHDYLIAHCSNVVDWVAYPNGDCNASVAQAAKEAGMHWGVTLEAGWERPDIENLHAHRMMLRRELLWGSRAMSVQCEQMNAWFSLRRLAVRTQQWIRG